VVALPSYMTCLSAGCSIIFGNYSGGQTLSLLSSARAVGAAGAGIPMLLIAEHEPRADGLDGLPSNHVTEMFLYGAAGLLVLALGLILLLNPYPIVKEPKDPTNKTEQRERP
jgi:hypothetical protein